MSEAPGQCRFCGCEDVHSDGFPAIDGGRERRFACGTQWREDGESWSQDVLRCKRQVGRLYQRLSRALQVLRKLDRYNVEPCSRMEWCKEGDWVDFCSVQQAIQILQEGQQ